MRWDTTLCASGSFASYFFCVNLSRFPRSLEHALPIGVTRASTGMPISLHLIHHRIDRCSSTLVTLTVKANDVHLPIRTPAQW